MSNTKNIAGNLIGIKIDGDYYNCQTALDLTLGSSLTKNPICKPNPGATSAISWETSNVDSKNWTATFSAQSFLDSIVGFKNNNDLMQKFIAGDLHVEVSILTNDSITEAEGYDHDFLFEGSAILSTVKLNAPAVGGSTWDVTLTGNGEPTFTLIPSTT